MNSQWRDFLESQSITIDGHGQVQPTHAPSYPDCALTDLSHLGLIRVAGEDAEHFLQGQVTSDIREVTADRSQISAYCTPKGRMLASILIFRQGQDYLLQMPLNIHESIAKRLAMFVLMSKVRVTDASDELVRIGISGECARTLLERDFPTMPQADGRVSSNNGVTLLQLPGRQPRFELLGDSGPMILLWQKLAKRATLGDPDFWSLLDIRAGIPTIYPDTVEAFVPQMANLHLIDGVSFTKGCYTGQEVVARMKYLGKLKRRMYLAHVDAEQRPQPGDELFSSGGESGQGPGRIVDARPSPEGGFDLLAVMEITRFDENDLHLLDAHGPKLRFQDLPYNFEREQ